MRRRRWPRWMDYGEPTICLRLILVMTLHCMALGVGFPEAYIVLGCTPPHIIRVENKQTNSTIMILVRELQ